MADYIDVPGEVPGWAVATAVNAAVARVISLHEAIQDQRFDDAAIIAEGIEVDLPRWLREASEGGFKL